MKYNLSKIMKTAWIYIREGKTKSGALRKSWQKAKQAISYKQWKPFLDHKRDNICRKYGKEKHEIENELYIWFCSIVEKYDSKKSCIYTYLQSQFKGFLTSVQRQKKKEERDFPLAGCQGIEDRKQKRFQSVIDFYYEVNEKLSKEAQAVLQFIFDYEFSLKKTKVSARRISKEKTIQYFNDKYGWKKITIKKAWKEIDSWWKEYKNAA